MGASKRIRHIIRDKEVRQADLAEAMDMPLQSFYNLLQRDTMSFERAEMLAEMLGCEIVFRDKETGKIY